MKRVVITGLGVVSSIGNDAKEVLASLKEGRSGISRSESFADIGLRSQVWGKPEITLKDHIDRKAMRFMGDASAYAYIAMNQAIEDAKLTPEQVSKCTYRYCSWLWWCIISQCCCFCRHPT